MLNYQRLLELPLKDALKELGVEPIDIPELLTNLTCEYLPSCSEAKYCDICEDVDGICSAVCSTWLYKESDPDANHYKYKWHNGYIEDPPKPEGQTPYYVLIDGASIPITLMWDGTHWMDFSSITYKVKYWMPLFDLPEVI